MKKLLLSALALTMGMGMMKAQDKVGKILVYVNAPTAKTTAFQCDVVMPTGVTATESTELSNSTKIKTGTIDATFAIAGNTIDGAHRIVEYSTNNNAFAKAGCVATFDVNIDSDFSINACAVKLKDGATEIVNNDSEVESAPTIVVRLQGDVTGDGKVNMFDYNKVVSDFKTKTNNMYSDVNHDGLINMFDYAKVLSVYKTLK